MARQEGLRSRRSMTSAPWNARLGFEAETYACTRRYHGKYNFNNKYKFCICRDSTLGYPLYPTFFAADAADGELASRGQAIA